MGWIEVVVGPMFSGKSEELIRRLRRAEIARQRVQIFKPAIDERYAANEIVSHSGLGIPSDAVFKAAEIMEKLSPRTEVIGIDEEITKLLAICVRCGNPAVHTQRLVESEELIVVGAMGAYEARCRRCFEPNPALAQEKKDGPQLIARNRAAGGG